MRSFVGSRKFKTTKYQVENIYKNCITKIKKVVQPGIFGKDGRVDINFMYIYGTDGTEIPVFVGELAKQQAKSYAGAAGAAIGGMIILGPIGAIGGAFVKGSSVVIPAALQPYMGGKTIISPKN